VACGLLTGLGAGAVDAAINAYAADQFLPRQVTWLHACYGVGATLGPFTMTAVLSAGRSWRWGYALIGAVLSLMSFLFLATQRLWEVRAGQGGEPAAPAATAVETLRLPLAWAHIALFFIYCGLEITAGQWLYSLLTGSRGFAPALAGTCVGLYWGGLTAGRVAFGVAAVRFPRDSILRLSMIAAPVGALLIWWGGAPALTLAAATLLGFALAPVYPLLISATPDRLGREYSAHAIGFQVSAAYLGGAALPSAAGILARARGLEVLGAFLFCVSLGLLTLHELALRMPRPRGQA
jgi:fucose permease